LTSEISDAALHRPYYPILSTRICFIRFFSRKYPAPDSLSPPGRMRDHCRPACRRWGRASPLPATEGRGEPETWCSSRCSPVVDGRLRGASMAATSGSSSRGAAARQCRRAVPAHLLARLPFCAPPAGPSLCSTRRWRPQHPEVATAPPVLRPTALPVLHPLPAPAAAHAEELAAYRWRRRGDMTCSRVLVHVASVCLTCFRCLVQMLQK
jgi:hypothetical protein